MATFVPAKKNTAYTFYVGLVSQADTKLAQVNPTLAAGDFKVAIDDGAPANLATLPVVDADFTKRVKIVMSASEMNGDNITIIANDAAGAQWCDAVWNIQTSARQVDDLAYPAVSGRALNVGTTGVAEANLKQIDDLATNANLATLNLKQLNIVNTAGDAIIASATGSNGNGINASGNGTAAGVKATGGATGNGVSAAGGSTSGSGVVASATSGDGFQGVGGTNGKGIKGAGAGTGAGFEVTGGINGSGMLAQGGVTLGNGIEATALGTGHGIRTQGGSTSGDGVQAVSVAGNGHGIHGIGNGTGFGLNSTLSDFAAAVADPAALAGAMPATNTRLAKIDWLFNRIVRKINFNKTTGKQTLYNSAGTAIASSIATDDGTTTEDGQLGAP